MNLCSFSSLVGQLRRRKCRKKLAIVGLVSSSAWLAIAPFSRAVFAQDNTPNCPGIFYEKPFTSRVAAPAGCPLTEYQQQLQATEPVVPETTAPDPAVAAPVVNDPTTDLPVGISGIPLPESRDQVVEIASPTDNQLSISLMNNTGALVTYEVVGDTQVRELMPNESAMLQDLPLPKTITLVRPDAGLLDITAESMEDGMLQISLSAETTLDSTQGVIRIQPDGQVFVN